jgi:uncharacterized oligopeptide transporter (OPT) family protein
VSLSTVHGLEQGGRAASLAVLQAPASSVIVTMVLAGLIAWVWGRGSPRTSELYMTPLASGLIAGEALVAVVVPLLVLAGVLGG